MRPRTRAESSRCMRSVFRKSVPLRACPTRPCCLIPVLLCAWLWGFCSIRRLLSACRRRVGSLMMQFPPPDQRCAGHDSRVLGKSAAVMACRSRVNPLFRALTCAVGWPTCNDAVQRSSYRCPALPLISLNRRTLMRQNRGSAGDSPQTGGHTDGHHQEIGQPPRADRLRGCGPRMARRGLGPRRRWRGPSWP